MPRQLPWKGGGGGSRTQTTKPPARPSRPTRIPNDFDDDLFETSSRGRDKAKATSESDSSLPERHGEESPPRHERARTKDPKERRPSSSPPPLADYTLPHSEPMRRGLSKFDLRDDEWMMVEDEFLETAKLFTKHLHILEYDRLKETIAAKKNKVAQARPVVAGAERSAEGALKEKAKAQEIRQKQAIRDVFDSQGDSSEGDVSSVRRRRNKPTCTTAQPRLPSSKASSATDTDSDDLDARRLPNPQPTAPVPKPPAPTTTPTAAHPSRQPAPNAPPPPPPSSFPRPAPPGLPTAPTPRKGRPRPRTTPFDMLDAYPSAAAARDAPQSAPPYHPPQPQTHTAETAEMAEPTAPSPRPRRRPSDGGRTVAPSSSSREALERRAKTRAERAKGDTKTEGGGGGGGGGKPQQHDDIPTFLF
ncbi:hypothetical protein G6514_001217 [Epicoccum nigrum]|nr:hypothetical protein G6514_001217 [Epicoccum nigrum]